MLCKIIRTTINLFKYNLFSDSGLGGGIIAAIVIAVIVVIILVAVIIFFVIKKRNQGRDDSIDGKRRILQIRKL